LWLPHDPDPLEESTRVALVERRIRFAKESDAGCSGEDCVVAIGTADDIEDTEANAVYALASALRGGIRLCSSSISASPLTAVSMKGVTPRWPSRVKRSRVICDAVSGDDR
jgi:hypothetical protein